MKDDSARWLGLFEANLGIPFTEGNEVVALPNGVEIFPAMLEAIDRAGSSVDFLTFVYWTGDIAKRFAAALCRAAARGVRTRVILDSLGAHAMDRELVVDMERAGIDVEWFRPIRLLHLGKASHRTHRKVLVCDGEVGFTGGVGIAQEWEGDAEDSSSWRETHFRLRGPAVAGLAAAFLGTWLDTEAPRILLNECGATPAPRGGVHVQVVRTSAAVGWSDVATCFQTLMQAAERRIRLTTPYFVPDEATLGLVCDAARRGVRVELLVPGPHIDQRLARLGTRDNFTALLEAGVEVWCFQPTMVHAKTLTVDGVFACLGSANFNHRSMRKDDEILLNVVDEELVGHLDRHFAEDLARSEPVDLATWKDRSVSRRILEALTRPLRGEM